MGFGNHRSNGGKMKRHGYGKTVLPIAIFLVLTCFIQFTFIIYGILKSSNASIAPTTTTTIVHQEDAPNTHVANNNTTVVIPNVSIKKYKTQKNITIEKRWPTINETKPGIHIFSNEINVIHIVGERHSGTTFFEKHLKKCFPDQTIVSHFVRKKHWMQPSPTYVVETTQKYGKEGLKPTELENLIGYKSWWQIGNSPDPKREFNTSLVLLLVRNPYDWLEAMRLRPHHWPNHVDLIPSNSSSLKRTEYKQTHESFPRRRLMHAALRYQQKVGTQNVARKKPTTIENTPEGAQFGDSMPPGSVHRSFFEKSILDWREFLRRPMYVEDYTEVDANSLCQKGFSFGEVSPCVRNVTFVPQSLKNIPRSFLRKLPFDTNDVVYELLPGKHGGIFNHPMQLRAEKIQNFLEMAILWELGGFGLIRYSELTGVGLESTIGKIASALNIVKQCLPSPPFNHSRRSISQEFRDWITTNTDWYLEALIGFQPETS